MAKVLKWLLFRGLALAISLTVILAMAALLNLIVADNATVYANALKCREKILLNDLYYYGPSWKPGAIGMEHMEARGSRQPEYLGIQTGPEGFRYQRNKLTPSGTNIAVLGGSEIWGTKLREADTLPAILERNFKGAKVFNFGVPSLTAETGIRILRHNLENFPTDSLSGSLIEKSIPASWLHF